MPSIVQLGKRKWLAGLAWSSYEAAPNISEIKEDAERLKSNWYCIRTNESVIQGGFCEGIEGVKRPNGLYSLAAKLADSHEQPWIGVFRLDQDLWWYIAIRDGHAILPDGDLIGTAEEIDQVRQNHAGYADWKYVEGDRNYLEELVKGIDAKPRSIKSLDGNSFAIAPMLALSVLTLALCGGGFYWWTQQQKVKEQARLAEIKLVQDKTKAGTPAGQAPVSPLLAMPITRNWLKACGEQLLPLPLVYMGWELSKVVCAGDSLNVDWTRGTGATVARKPGGELSSDGESVHQVIPLLQDKHGIDDAQDIAGAKVALRAWAQSVDFKLDFIEKAPAAALPGASGVAAPAVLHQVDFNLGMPVSPFSFDFPEIPGLRLTSIEPTADKWILVGVIYGK